MLLKNLFAVAALASARHVVDTVEDPNSPLVVLYFDNWAVWQRKYGVDTLERNVLSRNLPVRNMVINYSFFAWNPNECWLMSTDNEIDFQKPDDQNASLVAGDWGNGDWAGPGGSLNGMMKLKAKYPGLKILPSVGGWSRSHTFHNCLKTKMDTMIKSSLAYVRMFGFDGIDFDWEYPNCDGKPCGCQNEHVCTHEMGTSNQAGPGDWDRYKEFLMKLRAEFDVLEDQLQRQLYITAALGVNPTMIDGNNEIFSVPQPIEWICDTDYFDWVNLMTYDIYGPWASTTGPLAPLYSNPSIVGPQMSIDDSLQRILKRCSRPEKLTMGLATYGKVWGNVPRGTGAVPGLWQDAVPDSEGRFNAKGTWERGTISVWDVENNLLTSPNCQRTFDDISMTPTVYCSTMPDCHQCLDTQRSMDKDVFVSYEDAQSWKAKMEYARKAGMAGGIIWAASDFAGGRGAANDASGPLFQALVDGYSGPSAPIPPPGTQSGAFTYPTLTKWSNYPCPGVMKNVLNAENSHTCASLDYSSMQGHRLVGTGSTSPTGVGKKLIVKVNANGAAPTAAPTVAPPTAAPTYVPPTAAPTYVPPTAAPTVAPPTVAPTAPTTTTVTKPYCTNVGGGAPGNVGGGAPTAAPTAAPTVAPPTPAPTAAPTTTTYKSTYPTAPLAPGLAWEPAKVYDVPCTNVFHNGIRYVNAHYTVGDEPTPTTNWGPWRIWQGVDFPAECK